MREDPVVKDLVLIGGGHSHVEVLRRFGMRPVPGVRLTLVSRDVRTPYSGMLPGVVAGHYAADAAFIDLVRLCRWSGTRFIHGEASGLDPNAKTVLLDGRPPLSYDLVSINVGAVPALDGVTGDPSALIRTKPIDRFLAQWAAFERRARAASSVRVVVVGGGAAGVELALAVEHRIRSIGTRIDVQLITAQADVLVSHNARVRRKFHALLERRGVGVRVATRVVARTLEGVVDEHGATLNCDEVIWATQAAPPPWIASSGLAVDERGFLRVDPHLRSESHVEVFGAGDVASSIATPRPKAGVFAVRQGPVLARNLRAALLEEPLTKYRPQRRFLSLISAGERYAVASRGAIAAAGAWVWRWKDRIDRRFMERYNVLLPMAASHEAARLAPVLERLMPPPDLPDAMRCGGCGAKVPAETLRDAIAALTLALPPEAEPLGIQADDAALLCVPANNFVAVSIDAFRPLVADPFVFGEICANHALNDLYAMGARPYAALALATLPVWPAAKLTAEWVQMTAGAQAAFTRAGARIVGGHTSEGREVSLGFSVIGFVAAEHVRRKTGLRVGDALVLTKPLGTGALLAADMRAQADGRWIAAALIGMRQSGRGAAECLSAFEVSAMTDVTGFGLAGHLLEMLGDGDVSARIDMAAVPALAGALDMLQAGWYSSLHASNRANAMRHMSGLPSRGAPEVELLFDPQTAGGLIAGVPEAVARECVDALRRAGYGDAAIIGRVEARATYSGLPASTDGANESLALGQASMPLIIVD